MVYTEEELKKWFDIMIKKYRNSGAYWELTFVYNEMFEDELDNLKKVLDKEKTNWYNKYRKTKERKEIKWQQKKW